MDGGYRRIFRLDRRTARDAAGAVDEELEHHIDLVVEELVASGWPAERAREEAVRQFGDLNRTRDYCVEMQARKGRVEGRSMAMDDLLKDLRYSLRSLGGAKGYATLVVLTLAFGIAANTTIFSLLNPYLLRPLPYGDADRLVHITQVNPVTGWHMDRLSAPIFEDWKTRTRSLQEVGAYGYSVFNLTGPEGAEAVNLSRVSANMFRILRAEPLLGRTFGPDEGGPGGEDVVVLDYGLWNRRYNGDPDVIGRGVPIDGVVHTIIGVMPPDFVFPFGTVRGWLPIREDPAAVSRSLTPYLLVGRMSDSATPEQVDAELSGIQRELAGMYPEADGRWDGVTVLPMRQALNFAWEILSVSFTILLAAVVFVLAIACVNVASLTLARGSTRIREVAVRTALGATRSRVVRQLLTESLILSVAGGLVGVTLSWWAARLIGPVLPADLYRVGAVSIDGTVLAFSLVITLVTPLIFGLAPALAATRRSLVEGLKEGSKGSGGPGAVRGRKVLVTVQIAMAVVLTTGAGLMVRSFSAVQAVDVGFDPERVLTVGVQPPEASYPLAEVPGYVERAVAELRALPGVTAASASLFIPLNHEVPAAQFASPETAGMPAEEWPTAIPNYPYPGYFETMGIPVLAGRPFAWTDNRDADRVVVVNETLAERLWGPNSPVGRTLLVGDPAEPVEATVVGVVGDVLHESLDGAESRPQLYRPALQVDARRHFLVVRTEGDPTALIDPARRALRELDGNLPLAPRAMQDVVAENRLQWGIGAAFLGVFGAGALLLATLGIYGLISFSVAQRSRELGVRVAMGATRSDLRRVVVGDGVRLGGIGLGVGLVVAVGLARLIASQLFGVPAFDPMTLLAVSALFLVVAVLASWHPAQRASRTDPITVLRAE